MAYEAFKVAVIDHIARVTLNRPEALNAMHSAFWVECRAIFEELGADPQVRVIVISSSGKHFSAGIDLGFLSQMVPDATEDPARMRDKLRHRILELQASFSAIANCRVPVLAAIHGGCIGAAVDLAAACDMRYCTSDAYFLIQEVNIGMVADLGALQRMPLQLPQGLLRELAYTGRKLEAEEARDKGFVNAVAPNLDALKAYVLMVAAQIASKSPLAVTGSKHIFNQAIRRDIEDGLDYIATWNAGQLSFEDISKGGKAALARSAIKFDDLLE